MMTNLFSTFDPANTINISMNWMSTMLGLMIIPSTYWIMPSRYTMIFMKIMMIMHSEFKLILNKTKGFTLMFVTMFMFILMNNMMGLLPYVFTSSSHLTFTLTLALPMWMSLMIFGWMNNTQHMFAHLIPAGTPSVLMPFMVCIETISNLIRPGSLAVRLTANMIAGHLLMSLLGNNMTNTSSYLIMSMMVVQMMLMAFETAVSMIQAYVFSILSTLYSSEVNYENTPKSPIPLSS
uniref:ATP synthase subunit a n=1 Tax=Macrosaldula sp. PJ-2017 TaxID=2021942 RepID=A0A343ISD0_9HEMI|nr:ATP synthase F0 subunit 6 [Macrosaldula sp. PJ-2017]AST10155.1 ATP synthase F0 subunit 6 [Macrosaldula sp. PJ-2017]